jgi:hypothetical protein
MAAMSNRASSGLSQVGNHVHVTACHASCRSGQACYHHHRPKNPAAYPNLVEPASLLVLDALTYTAVSYRSSMKAWAAPNVPATPDYHRSISWPCASLD